MCLRMMASNPFQILVFDHFHDAVVFPVRLGTALVLGDGQRGEAVDIFVLPLNHAQDAFQAGDRCKLIVEGPGK